MWEKFVVWNELQNCLCERVYEMERAIVIFKMLKRNEEVDLDIPLNISANDLVQALNKAYNLGINTSDLKKCYFKAENPIALLRGSQSLEKYGIRNGSSIIFSE